MGERPVRRGIRGFTLIELMIVVGIIVILVAVLAVAILPYLKRIKPKKTQALLQTVGGAVVNKTFREKTFRRDVGSLSGQISSDAKIRSSQMLAFYLCPSRRAWDQSRLYAGQVYDPELDADSLRNADSLVGDGDLLQLVDAWGNPIWYHFDKKRKTLLIESRGEDEKWNTDDDIIYDARVEQTVMRENFK